MKKIVFIIMSLMVIANVNAMNLNIAKECIPQNDLSRPTDMFTGNGMTQEKFNGIIDKVDGVYNSIVTAKGGKLIWQRKWDDETVNASAMQIFNFWLVNMYGGLARHELVTPDAFALVVCHELGHHLGGAPKVGGGANAWASNEGQSDYFGAMKCFRRVFVSDNNPEIVAAMDVDQIVTEKCQESFSSQEEIALCERTSMAGKSLAALLSSLKKEALPQFDTPDTTEVSQTNDKHPAGQCRLDTYFAGSICAKPVSEDVSNSDPNVGVCSRTESSDIGVRPLCWYKP